MKIEIVRPLWYSVEDVGVIRLAIERMAEKLNISHLDESVRVRFAHLKEGAHVNLETRNPVILSVGFCGVRSAIMRLSHEMVHIKQYLTGEISQKGDDTLVFHGKEYTGDEVINPIQFSGTHLPWEREPYGRMWAIYHDAIANLPSAARLHLHRAPVIPAAVKKTA